MRKTMGIILSVLLFLQLLSAGVFIVGLYPHLVHIWYIHDIGWWNAIKQEYSLRGGVMFVVEIVFIFLVLVQTVTFEIWQLAHNDEAQKRRDAIQLAHAKKNGVTEADIQEQEELLNAKSKKKHK